MQYVRMALFVILGFIFAVPARADERSRELVGAMIEAHGGMRRWSSSPSVSFEDHWMLPGGFGYGMQVVVEQGRRRSYAAIVGTEAMLGWDGEKTWAHHWSLPAPPRFMAQLNYYFLNLPWLTRDPGVVLRHEGLRRLARDTTEYEAVRMTFEPGTGDTPNDYYVLYIHPESHLLKACEYIVTYRALLPEGVEHTPPHVLVYEEYETVNELKVPTKFTIYKGESVYAECKIRNWSFDKPFDASRVEMPDGAVVDESQP